MIGGSVAHNIGHYLFTSLSYIVDERCGTIPDLLGLESIFYLNSFGAKDAFKLFIICIVTFLDILSLTNY